jgi:putative chitinase
MIDLDEQRFMTDLPSRTGLRMIPEREKAVTFILGKLRHDPGFTMIRELAYVLATIRWETAHSFTPLRERRVSRARNPRVWEWQTRYWTTGFYGRGYVQITWEKNYRKAGQKLAGATIELDPPVPISADTFVKSPDYVMQPDVAYTICARGMQEGWFTGKRLGDYIREGEPPDYVNARRIVNGTDHARDIAELAGQFELVLRAARI